MLKQKNLLILALIVFCSISMCLSMGCKKKAQVKEEPVEPAIKEEPVETTQVEEPVKPPPEDTETTDVVEAEMIEFDMIYFDFDRYNLRADSRETLAEISDSLKNNPAIKVLIKGHCDDRGTIEYNLQLGKRRAESARSYLIASGINSSRLSTISYGEEKPIAAGQNERSWAKNRRDEFTVVSK